MGTAVNYIPPTQVRVLMQTSSEGVWRRRPDYSTPGAAHQELMSRRIRTLIRRSMLTCNYTVSYNEIVVSLYGNIMAYEFIYFLFYCANPQ